MPLDLYMQCKKNLEFNTKNNHRQVMDFLDNLPHKLRMDVTHIIHEKRYQNIKFLNNKSNSFLNWLCPLFTPVFFGAKQYIYSEGEDILHINILLKG